MNKIEIYDIEQFPNFHSYTGISKEDGDTKSVTIFFEISERKNQIKEYITHLRSLTGMIGFNNLNYDYPMIHYILQNEYLFSQYNSEQINRLLYKKSQEIINADWSSIPEWEVIIPQLDLFKIYHFDNKAKRTSLKDVAIAINHDWIQDLPYRFDDEIYIENIDKVLEYNINDVVITKKLYELSTSQINLRKDLSNNFGINFMNANDTKIGSDIFLYFLSKKLEKDKKEIKDGRTYRKIIHFRDCILKQVSYSSNQFNKLLNDLKNKSITQTKSAIDYSVIYKGFKYDFGTGGIHGAAKSFVYIPNKDEIIYSSDVTSYYPNLAIKNNFYPQHLTKVFCEIYEWLFNERKKIPKSNPFNKAYKLSLNGSFGKSNSAYSFFYDPKFTMQITINGQLLLTMLAEKMQDEGFKLLMINTDGFECVIPKNKEEKYLELCKEWEELTQLNLEHDKYKKLVLRDVNNYLAVNEENSIKLKGAFEINKELHKDPSFKIVPIAIKEYFVKGTPIEKTIKDHTEIYDFCGRYKATQGWHAEIGGYKIINDTPTATRTKLQKTNRYFISNKGGTFYKCHVDGREQVIESGWGVTIFNMYEKKDIKDYDIDYQYYINECMKIIRVVEPEQLSMF